jgi:hypothetical protein
VTLKLGFVWLLADTLYALMEILNLIALTLLSPVVFKILKKFFETRGKSEKILSDPVGLFRFKRAVVQIDVVLIKAPVFGSISTAARMAAAPKASSANKAENPQPA